MEKAIFLCGFMGAGKSSVGRALAKELGWPLLDTDELIQQENGPVPQIFAEKGEPYFRQLEAEMARRLALREKAVISTGGGFVLSKAVQDCLKESCVVYLDVPFEDCYKRIKNSDRPLVRANSKEALEALYERRGAVYRAVSSVSVKNSGELEETVKEIIRQVR